MTAGAVSARPHAPAAWWPRVVALAAVAAALAGCASPSQPDSMAAPGVKVEARSAQRVAIDVAGGRATSASGAPQIANADFREALRRSIVDARLFADVADDASGAYRLGVLLGELRQPLFGASMTATLEASYTLVELASGRTVWSKSIRTSHTVGGTEALVGVTRLRMATEGAARRNIEEAIREMGQLGLR